MPSIYWLIKAMMPMLLLSRQPGKASPLSFRQKTTAKYSVNMMTISTNYATSWKTHSHTSSVGEGSLRDMPKTHPLSSRLYTSDASPFGLKSRHYGI